MTSWNTNCLLVGGQVVSVNRGTTQAQAGFTLIELVAVMALALALGGIAVPSINAFLRQQRAATGARMIEQTLQTARLKSVSASRALRVRLNCPAVGQLRILELTGVAATDNASNRCDTTAFPTPGPSDTLRSTPSLDSGAIILPKGTTVAGAALEFEFSPQGTAYAVGSTGTVSPIAGDATLTVTRDGVARTVTLNGLGRIRLN